MSVAFLFDDTLDSSDGVAQYVKTLGAWMSSQGHEVSYLVGQTKMKQWAGDPVRSLSRNLPVSFNANRLSIPLPASSHRIKKLLAGQHFDVLHVQMPHSPFMSQKVINRASSSTAVVGTFHILPAGWLASWGSRLLRLMYLLGLRRFDRMISVSLPAAEYAKKFFGVGSEVLPNVVDLRRFNSVKASSKHKISNDILFLGRLVSRKGCYQLLEAFTLLHKRQPAVRLTIAGDGPQRKTLEKFATQRGIEDAVSFLGFVDETQKPQLLRSAKLACFPSLYGESFGIVLIEAMAAGAGVVLGGNNPGYRSVLAQQPELLVNPTDTTAFARRLELLLNDAQLRRRLKSWQTKHVKQFDVNIVGPQMVEVYRLAIANRRQKSHN